MTEEELRFLISDHEADHVELTIATKDSEKFSEAVCAFANDYPASKQPGYLIIGVNNDKKIVGAEIDERLLASLGGLRSDGNIQPLPEVVIEKVATSEGDVAVITVFPSLLPPVRYKGRTCIRIGPRKAYASAEEERRLSERRISGARTFDAEPCIGAQLDALSESLFSIEYRPQVVAPEVIEENGRPLPEQLASLRFFDLSQRCATNAGILLFGFEPTFWLAGAYITFLRVAGTSLADETVNERQLSGDLFTVLRELDALIDAQLVRYPGPVTLLRETMIEFYPRVAVRELVLNGILHRDYASTAPLRITWFDNRIEIQSPGGLYGEVSPENFPRQTSYRNPVIAEAMKALGYVNRYGRGVIRAQEALRKNGGREAEFEFSPTFVLATIWSTEV